MRYKCPKTVFFYLNLTRRYCQKRLDYVPQKGKFVPKTSLLGTKNQNVLGFIFKYETTNLMPSWSHTKKL